MDKYLDIKNTLIKYANSDIEIQSIIAIGSTTRQEVKADEYSDLDLIIVTNDTQKWFSYEYPQLLGNMKIVFQEPTLGNGREVRAIYDEEKDVDMIVFTLDQFYQAIIDGVASWVMNRGYEILFDRYNFKPLLDKYISSHSYSILDEKEYTNVVNDFYFHCIWAYKKLRRNEIWSSKMCVDAYLKNHVLKVMEMYSYQTKHVDVWHDGRFLDSWLDINMHEQLEQCFAHYDKDEIYKALLNTFELFSTISEEIAVMNHYSFPYQAKECAKNYIYSEK